MAEKFPNLMKAINVQIHKTQQILSTEIWRKLYWHIKMKLLNTNDKEKILKAGKGE